MDVISMSPSKTWDGKDVDAAVVVVDRHSGWVDAYPVRKPGLTSKVVAHLLHERWMDSVGVPQEVVTDFGP